MVETLDKLEKGELVCSPQRDEEATYAPRLRKQDGRITWEETAQRISRQVRAMLPWPAAHTFWRGKQLKILKARALVLESTQKPGTVLKARGDSLWIATGKGILEVLKLQPESRPAMAAQAFISGRGISEGEVLGSH